MVRTTQYICSTYVSILCHQWAWFLSVLFLDLQNHISDIGALKEIDSPDTGFLSRQRFDGCQESTFRHWPEGGWARCDTTTSRRLLRRNSVLTCRHGIAWWKEGRKMTDEPCVFNKKMMKWSTNGSTNGPVMRRENLNYIEIRVILLKNASTGLYKLCINRRFPVRSTWNSQNKKVQDLVLSCQSIFKWIP